MTIKAAKEYLSRDIREMSVTDLQKHKVNILDAWRESRAEYGIPQAIRDGFLISMPEMGVDAVVPVDYWLTHNLSKRLDEIDVILSRIYQ